MSKSEFIRSLDRMLSQLPENERKRHTGYYEELIDDMVESGINEYDAVTKLGDPKSIANDILTDTPLPLLVKTKVRPSGGWTALTIILAILSCPIWLPIVIALFATLIAVYAVFWVIVIAFAAIILGLVFGGLAVVIVSPFAIGTSFGASLLMIGWSLTAVGIGILLCYMVYWAGLGIVNLTKLIARWIKSLFIRKGV